jgi:hypothetical protein
VAALFQPARRRIQRAVDRPFNAAATTAKIIQAFSAQLRNQTDLDMRSAELLAVAHQTMEPITASLWLRPPVNRARHVSHSRRTACCESRSCAGAHGARARSSLTAMGGGNMLTADQWSSARGWLMAWQLQGRYFENCSCDMVCPCTTSGFTMPADYERCRVVLVFHVDAGTVEDVDVSELTVACWPTPRR